MKLSVKPALAKLIPLSAGSLGLFLRTILYATGIDAKGLLISGHWAAVSLWILSGITVAALLLLTRSIQGPEEYSAAYPASALSGIGAFAAASAVAYTVMSELAVTAPMALVLGSAAALSLAYVGICRVMGRRPFFLCHALVCVFFAMRMVLQYRNWNSDPQVMNFVFYLGSFVALMLHAYQQSALDADMGNHRALWCTGLITVYLCCVSLLDSADPWLIPGAAVWVLTNLPRLNGRSRRQRPALNLDGEPQEEV